MCCIYVRGTRSSILCYIFPHVERALVLLCCIFRTWDALWRYCVIFSVGGTCSGVIVLYFPHVEHALVFCVIFSACGTLSGVIVLYFLRVECNLALLCYIFPPVERAISLLCYIFCTWNVLWYFVLNSFRIVIYLRCEFFMFISKLS